jgi:MFS family permease
MFNSIFSWVRRYERHLSAGAIFAGFIVDSIFLQRVDVLQTHAIFAVYTILCLTTIPLLHAIEARVERGRTRPRWSAALPLITQFALGGFWSGFVIFYGRSAELGASWPFLLLLIGIFFGAEYFREYHARLVFTSTLFFFALYSYAIFAVPIYLGTIGIGTFVLSGAVAIGAFILFTMLLRTVAYERFALDVWRLRAGALSVLVVMNIFYFTNVLPPLPLAAKEYGVYHSVVKTQGVYTATDERHTWRERFFLTPTFHLPRGGSLAAYSAIFAPTKLATTVVHRWQRYNEELGVWETRASIPYSIVGGRDGGYKGYSVANISDAGKWRVNIETGDGRRIARTVFYVQESAQIPAQKTIILK